MAGAHVTEAGNSANKRGMVFQEALNIVSNIQLWKLGTTTRKGDSESIGFEGLTFRSLGFSHTFLSKRVYKTDFACYMIRTTGEQEHAELSFFAPSCSKKDFVARVIIQGTNPGDLDWLHTPSSGYSVFDR